MSAVQSLRTELKNLSSLSKRNNQDLAQKCEHSLNLLNTASSKGDDAAVIASLEDQPEFVVPLILACSEASAKACANALQCVQILAQYKGIAQVKLHDLLQALMEATKLGLGIQLKILQALPALLYNFSSDLDDTLVVDLLAVCSELLGTNKVNMVHNAAYATLQQLITGVFDRIELPDNLNLPVKTIDLGSNDVYEVPAHLYDASMILLDLCDLVDHEKPKFLKIKNLSLMFTLELFELTLSNQAVLFERHEVLKQILKLRIAPLLLRVFVGETSFPIVLRVIRVFYLLLRRHLQLLSSESTESEVILLTLIQSVSKEPLWKQVLSLEVLQGICMEEDLLLQIYSEFDDKKTRTNVLLELVNELTSVFTTNKDFILATDVTAKEYDLAMVLSAGNNDVSSTTSSTSNIATTNSSASNVSGKSNSASNNNNVEDLEHMILTKNSSQQPIIEVLDRLDPPTMKPEYKYYLILKSLTSLVENIHKQATKSTEISDLLQMISSPLQVFHSYGLGLAMDSDIYKLLIRSTQRLAHSSGILGLRDLRDEFITIIVQYCQIPYDPEFEKGYRPWLVLKCSLCVRALFTLGYALGNQLNNSWSLISQTVVSLSNQISQFVDPDHVTSDNLFGLDANSEDFNVISLSLQRLVENTANLKTNSLLKFMTAFTPVSCPIQYYILERCCYVNGAKFADPRTGCWKLFSKSLLELANVEENEAKCSEILNRCALNIMSTELESEEQEQERDAMVMRTFCEEIDDCSLAVKIETLNDLNDLLEKYGGHLKAGWETIFASVSPIPATGNIELMRPAFHTLELITNDFLDNIPYTCVFSLTLCLDEFSCQLSDLNISFTSTSLLWYVCDYLMHGDVSCDDLDVAMFKKEEDLIKLAREESSRSKRSALWLLALMKLAGIAENVPQQQVRTSALQIFLRLFSQNGSKLTESVWGVALSMVFPTLLNACKSGSENVSSEENDEALIIFIEGMSNLFIKFESPLLKSIYFSEFWSKWMNFLQWSVERSPKVAVCVFSHMIEILNVEKYSARFASSVAAFWSQQNPLPSYSEKFPKKTADSLNQLIIMYSNVKNLCDDSQALKLIGSCAKFPYYTVIKADNMSVLQKTCVDAISPFLEKEELRADVLETLGAISLTPYNTQPGHNFDGLAEWSLLMLARVVDQIAERDEISDGTTPNNQSIVIEKLPHLMTSMNTALRHRSQILPARIFVKVFSLCPVSLKINPDEITSAVDLFLNSYNSTTLQRTTQSDMTEEFADNMKENLNLLDEFIKVMIKKHEEENHYFDHEVWERVLQMLLNKSIFYERATLNTQYYQNPQSDDDEILLFGTVEIPKPTNHAETAIFSLNQLYHLSKGDQDYAICARKFYFRRVKATLLQYIGDRKLQGSEPMREILKSELIFMLTHLDNLRDDAIHKLVADCTRCANLEMLPYLQKITL